MPAWACPRAWRRWAWSAAGTTGSSPAPWPIIATGPTLAWPPRTTTARCSTPRCDGQARAWARRRKPAPSSPASFHARQAFFQELGREAVGVLGGLRVTDEQDAAVGEHQEL